MFFSNCAPDRVVVPCCAPQRGRQSEKEGARRPRRGRAFSHSSLLASGSFFNFGLEVNSREKSSTNRSLLSAVARAQPPKLGSISTPTPRAIHLAAPGRRRRGLRVRGERARGGARKERTMLKGKEKAKREKKTHANFAFAAFASRPLLPANASNPSASRARPTH